jgi:predicted Zn-dependent protease
MRIGKNDRAIEQFEAVRSARPNDVLALNNLAWLYSRTGDARALTYGEKAHELAPQSPDVNDTLGWILVERGEVDRGLRLLKEAAAAAPAQAIVQYHYAVALSRAGKLEDAQIVLANIVANNGTSPEAADARKLLDQIKKQ